MYISSGCEIIDIRGAKVEDNYGRMEIRLNGCVCFIQALYGIGMQDRRLACILSA